MTYITAEQAREISAINVQNHLKDAYSRIQEAAYAGKRSVLLRDPFWRDNTREYWKTAAKDLERAGFKVSVADEYMRQELYTLVEW
jgi:hypothetical protein